MIVKLKLLDEATSGHWYSAPVAISGTNVILNLSIQSTGVQSVAFVVETSCDGEVFKPRFTATAPSGYASVTDPSPGVAMTYVRISADQNMSGSGTVTATLTAFE